MSKKKADGRDVIVIADVARMLGVSLSQTRRLVRNAGLPHYQFSKRGQLHFIQNEVEGWMKKHSRQRKEA